MQVIQPSDKAVDLLREELNRLHQLLNKPPESPGKGVPKMHLHDWARKRIEAIHGALTHPVVSVPMLKNESK